MMVYVSPSTRMSTNPVLADWDGDGLPDLILGVSEANRSYSSRGVYWCRNVGTKGAPKFATTLHDAQRSRTAS